MGKFDDMEYKGYYGTVCIEDDYYYGEVKNVCGVVVYEGSTYEELNHYFKEAVDDMIKHCQKYNISPITGKKLSTPKTISNIFSNNYGLSAATSFIQDKLI